MGTARAGTGEETRGRPVAPLGTGEGEIPTEGVTQTGVSEEVENQYLISSRLSSDCMHAQTLKPVYV